MDFKFAIFKLFFNAVLVLCAYSFVGTLKGNNVSLVYLQARISCKYI